MGKWRDAGTWALEQIPKGTIAALFYISLFGAGGPGVLAYLSPSATMRAFIGAGGTLGFVIASSMTKLAWQRVSRRRRISWSILHLMVSFLFFVAGFGVLYTIDPDVARRYALAEWLREILLEPSLVADVVMFSLTILCAYCLTSGILMMSAFMPETPPGTRQRRPKQPKEGDQGAAEERPKGDA